VLAELIRDVGQSILYSNHVDEKGQVTYKHACKIGLEGVISKRVRPTAARCGAQ
jgi:ATP-dependent DNA ligase